jgi:hypothetical protein
MTRPLSGTCQHSVWVFLHSTDQLLAHFARRTYHRDPQLIAHDRQNLMQYPLSSFILSDNNRKAAG